jgi:hypothetical protein
LVDRQSLSVFGGRSINIHVVGLAKAMVKPAEGNPDENDRRN